MQSSGGGADLLEELLTRVGVSGSSPARTALRVLVLNPARSSSHELRDAARKVQDEVERLNPTVGSEGYRNGLARLLRGADECCYDRATTYGRFRIGWLALCVSCVGLLFQKLPTWALVIQILTLFSLAVLGMWLHTCERNLAHANATIGKVVDRLRARAGP